MKNPIVWNKILLFLICSWATKLVLRQPVPRPSVDERLIYTYWIKVMKVETTNLTSLPLCLAVIEIRTREITVQVRDRNLHTTNRQNDSEAWR